MSDPFGSNPFGEPTYGPTPHGVPPVFNAVAPVPRPANALATLSVVFAFVFAPAGAILGHLGLAQVRRTGQPGRGRALIGIVASYAIISIVIVAVTAWVILRPNATSSQGGSRPAIAASPVAVADLGKLLPGLDQLKTFVQQNDLLQGAPTIGLTAASITTVPPDCRVGLSTVDPQVYQHVDVAGVYRIDYRGTLREHQVGSPELTDYELQLAVVAFADPEHAAAAVRAMASVLQVCAGERVRATDSSGKTEIFWSHVEGVPVNVTTAMNYPTVEKMGVSRALAAKANVAIDLYCKGLYDVDYAHVADIANAIQAKIPG